MIRIREATLNDFESIYGFVNELEETRFIKKNQLKIFAENLLNPHIIYLVAEAEKRVVGFLSCYTQLLLHHSARVAEIQEMFIVKSMRNEKVGKRLLLEVIKRMKEKGITQVEVTSNKKRLAAHRFYEREKFRFTSKKFVLVNK
jgi:PhnO protein